VAFDKPGLDAAGTGHALDLHGVSRTSGERRKERKHGNAPGLRKWAARPRMPHGA
jgi:hypothetical protein